VVLYHLNDKQPNVHAPHVSSESERERKVLARVPNESYHGHQDSVDGFWMFAVIAKTEEEDLSVLLLFLGPSLQKQALCE
jgi:hypothetical protein